MRKFLKAVAVAVLLVGSAFAQDTAQQVFDNAYWASQPPQIQALRGTRNIDLAFQLASQGFLIDYPIMVWNWDAYTVMQERVSLGELWVPNMLQNPLGCTNSFTNGVCYALPNVPAIGGQVAYPAYDPPAGSIPVSVNPATYGVYRPSITR
jgi:hypothetical protein